MLKRWLLAGNTTSEVSEADSENDNDSTADFEVLDDYRDGIINETYHGPLTHQLYSRSIEETSQDPVLKPAMNPRPTSSELVDTSSAEIILETPVVSSPGPPSIPTKNMTPPTPFWLRRSLTEIASSLTEATLAVRKRGRPRLPC